MLFIFYFVVLELIIKFLTNITLTVKLSTYFLINKYIASHLTNQIFFFF